MTEIKGRIIAIQPIVALHSRGVINRHITAEFCYLQLRFVCELIALACLVAHDDIETTRSGAMRTLSSPDEILNRLEQLHSDFYPCPVIFISPNGNPVDIVTAKLASSRPTGEQYLSKLDLLDLYGVCGDALHRGSLKNLLAGPKPNLLNFDNIEDWRKKIWSLLQNHEIRLVDPSLILWCALGKDMKTKVHASVFSRVTP